MSKKDQYRHEQVNAWGNYETTAQSARHLNAYNRNRRHSTASLLLREQPAGWQTLLECRQSYMASSSVLQARLSEEADEEAGDTEKLNMSEELIRNTRAMFAVYFEDYQDDVDLQTTAGGGGGGGQQKDYSFYWWCWNATMPWIPDSLRKVPDPTARGMLLWLDLLLRGVAQVYFQNNPLSGVLILVALLVQDPMIAAHGVVALVVGNYTACGLGWDRSLIQSGLFGYNALLVGLAIATFGGSNVTNHATTMLASILFSMCSSVLFVVLGKLLVPYKSPPLTLPFNISTLLFLLSTASMTNVDFNAVRVPSLPDYNNDNMLGQIDGSDFFKATIRGMGQVFLADELISGLLVWAGIALCSRVSAIAAFAGSALGAACALAAGVPANQIVAGLYGFNSSLTFTAMFMFYAPSWGALIMAVLSSCLTVAAQLALNGMLSPYGLPAMTLPFCTVALPFIILQGTTSLVIAVPLASMTVPEDHQRRVRMLSEGFEFLKEAMRPHQQQVKTNETNQASNKKYGRDLSRHIQSMSDAISSSGRNHDNDQEKRSSLMSWRVVESNATTQEPWVRESAKELFCLVDSGNGIGQVHNTDFIHLLQAVGFVADEGVETASLVFHLMDLDKSQSIDMDEFVAFCIVSRCLLGIRRKIHRFMDFVDSNGDRFVDFDEMDAALAYLGEAGLESTDREAMLEVLPTLRNTGNIGVVELVNFVTVSKVRSLVDVYQECTSQCVSSASVKV